MAAQEGLAAELERRRLLERVQEQEGVIRQLWDRYKQDVGREPDVCELVADAGPRSRSADRAEAFRRTVGQEHTFEHAVDGFEPQWTRSFGEAAAQGAGARLLHDGRPAAAPRRACDVDLGGFWGRGVSMPAFERLIEKLRSVQVYRLDLSDNGLNGNFVPGVLAVARRGVRQLDLSRNALEAEAMQSLLRALPPAAPRLESLDLRFNPCQHRTTFAASVAGAVQQLKGLVRLAVTVRCDAGSTGADAGADAPAAGAPGTPARRRAEARQRPASAGGARQAPRRGGRAPSPRRPWRGAGPGDGGSWSRAQRFRAEADHGDHGAPRAAPEPSPWRARPLAQSIAAGDSRGAGGPAAGAGAGRTAEPEGAAGVVALVGAVAECSRLRALDLRASSLTHSAACELALLVGGERCQLVSLSLADCFLGEAAVPVLGAVQTNRGLVKLNLRLNALSDREGIPLCNALRESISLTDVDLASNDLSDDFGMNFARVLCTNDILWRVDLARNPLGSTAGDAILEVLKRRKVGLVSIGDTTNSLFGLGLQNRRQIQRFLDENSNAFGGPLNTGEEEEVNGLCLGDFEWSILEDLPRPLEPLMLLL